MQRIGSAATDLGFFVLVIVGMSVLISVIGIALMAGGHALFGPPDPATQMNEEEAALANVLDQRGFDVDYADFEPEHVTVYLRDPRYEQVIEACRVVRDEYDLSDSYSGPVDIQVAMGRGPMRARVSSERGDC